MEAAKTLKGDKQFFRPWEPRMNPETFPRSGNNAITFYDSKQTEDVPKKLQPKFQEPEQLINRTSQVLADKVSPTLDEYSSSFQLNKHFQQLGMLYFGGNFGRNFLENDPNLNPSATITQNSHPFRLASSGNSLLSEHENSFPKKYASSNVNFSRRHLFNAWDNKIFQISQFLNFQNSLKLPRGMAATQHMNNVKMHSINGNSQSLLTPESVQCLKKGWSGASVGTATALDLTRTSAKNDKKIFSCKICDKTYSSLGALKMHIRTHTLPCKCHICGKAFSRPWLLQGHIRSILLLSASCIF